MKIKSITYLLAILLLTFTACQKGELGLQGPQGEQGIPGANGSTILSGTEAPTANIGATGDFYLDKNTANLYGPKTDSGWGQPLNLKGIQGDIGEPGSAGSKILSGAGIPSASLGSIGDFYLDKGAIDLYGPKTDTGWGDAISLKSSDSQYGAQVLLIKGHKFQTVTRDEEADKNIQEQLKDETESKENIEEELNYLKSQYDQQVKNIEDAFTNGALNEDSYNQQLAQLKKQYDDNSAYYVTSREETLSQITELENQLAIGVYIPESKIALGSKYQDYYENGLVLVYLRDSENENSEWIDEDLIVTNEGPKSLACWVKEITKDYVLIQGYTSNVPEDIVKNTKIDIKIVFIPAASVEIMTAQHINMKNFQAVERFLRIE